MHSKVAYFGDHRALCQSKSDMASGTYGRRVNGLEIGAHLHDGSSLVVLDVSDPLGLVEGDVLGESLLLEVADGVVVGVGEEVLDGWVNVLDVVLEVVHQMTSVTLQTIPQELRVSPCGQERADASGDLP